MGLQPSGSRASTNSALLPLRTKKKRSGKDKLTLCQVAASFNVALRGLGGTGWSWAELDWALFAFHAPRRSPQLRPRSRVQGLRLSRLSLLPSPLSNPANQPHKKTHSEGKARATKGKGPKAAAALSLRARAPTSARPAPRRGPTEGRITAQRLAKARCTANDDVPV